MLRKVSWRRRLSANRILHRADQLGKCSAEHADVSVSVLRHLIIGLQLGTISSWVAGCRGGVTGFTLMLKIPSLAGGPDSSIPTSVIGLRSTAARPEESQLCWNTTRI